MAIGLFDRFKKNSANINKEDEQINAPNGKVHFVEFVGVTDRELRVIRDKEIGVKELYEKIKNDIMDYNRASVL